MGNPGLCPYRSKLPMSAVMARRLLPVALMVVMVGLALGALWYSKQPRGGSESPPAVTQAESGAPPGPGGPGPGGMGVPPGGLGGPGMSGSGASGGEASSPASGRGMPPAAGAMIPAPPLPGPAAQDSNAAAAATACEEHVRLLASAFRMYTTDYDGHLPPARRWCDALYPYLPGEEAFACPAVDSPYGYAFNRTLDGADVDDLRYPETTVLLFESSLGTRNATDSLSNLADPPRHPFGNYTVSVDGFVHLMNPRPPVPTRPVPANRF